MLFSGKQRKMGTWTNHVLKTYNEGQVMAEVQEARSAKKMVKLLLLFLFLNLGEGRIHDLWLEPSASISIFIKGSRDGVCAQDI
jgi:hypothetical protein